MGCCSIKQYRAEIDYVGCSKIRIREIQVLERKGETEFTVSSSPDLQVRVHRHWRVGFHTVFGTQIGMGPTLASTTQLAVNSKNEGSEVCVAPLFYFCSMDGSLLGVCFGHLFRFRTLGNGRID